MVAVVAEQKIGWECSAARNGCRYLVFALERPLFCGTCGKSNTYVATDRHASGARRARPAPRWQPTTHPEALPAVEPLESLQIDPGVLAVEGPPENASDAICEAPAGIADGPRIVGWRWGSEIRARHAEYARSGLEWWRRVTGDLPRKFLTVIEGKRGTGKTRTLLTVGAGVVRTMRRPVLYGCAEQPAEVLTAWCQNLGIVDELKPGGIALLPGRALEELLDAARELRPVVIVVDALKRYTMGGRPCKANTPEETAATEALVALADELDAAVVAVLHMQANGDHASVGSTPMQLCEVVVRMDKVIVGDPPSRAVCLSINEKNRWGPDDKVAYLEHHDGGIRLHAYDAKGGV